MDVLHTGEFISGNNYTRLFSHAPTPIAILKGREMRYVFINNAYAQIFRNRQILGKTVREAFPELEGQPYFGLLENVFDSGNPFYGYEIPAIVELGDKGTLTTRYFNLVYTPYTNEDNKIEGVMAFGNDVTEQVTARKQDKESDLRFRNIVEQSIDPISILKGKDLVLDVANEALLTLWNLGRESLGKTFLEIFPASEECRLHKKLKDVYDNGATHFDHETKTDLKDSEGKSSTHYFNFIYQPYLEADGSINGVIILAANVTEQVLAKQKLMHSETNFRNMVLQSPVAMCVLKGPDHIVEVANEGMYELWGKKKEEVLAKPIFEGLPEARGQGLEKLLGEVFTSGQRFTASELQVMLPREGNIKSVYVNFVYQALRAGDGTIAGVIVVATDVTEQVVSRHKIEYAEENARLAIESADLGTYEINLLTNEMFTSPRFKAIWGIDHFTTRRSEFAAVIHPEDLSERERAHRTSIRTGNLHYEARIKWKETALRWIRVKGKVLYDKKGSPARLLGVIQDITEQKLFAEELSNKVEERTKALKDANEQLARSNEELEQFAFIASHDLQEPIRKIQIFNNLVLERSGVNDDSKKYIEKVNEAAGRMTGLIRDLLEYSRLSQKGLQFEETDLNAVVKNVLSDYEVLIAQKHAIIKTDDLPALEAIPLQMHQLFFNLIGNALKFAKKDTSPEIIIEAEKLSAKSISAFPRLDPNQEYYKIKISDNGIGFNQEYADKIFTIFQRLNEKSLYGGYGIGLALCRKIVGNHSGIIYAEGAFKEGASFIFILPYLQH